MPDGRRAIHFLVDRIAGLCFIVALQSISAHDNDSMETLFEDLAAARQETLNLLEQFTDEQLAAPASLSFVANRTAGDLFAANAQHAAAHMRWIEEGFRQGL